MAEIKHNFTQGIMNKDLDERGVPDGQYRDALNIQVSTSDGSNVGVAQTLLGNIKHTSIAQGSNQKYYDIPNTSTVVGCVENRSTDKIYYFVSSGDLNNSSSEPTICKDYIMQYDTVSETHKYVFVDIFKIKTTIAVASTASNNFLYIPKGSNITDQDSGTITSSSNNITGVRVGMVVHGTFGDETYTLGSNIRVSDIIYNSSNSSYKIYLEENGTAFSPPSGVDVGDEIVFEAERVLSFNKYNYIHSINILDDFLLWTDGFSEPKKINIQRCIKGTGGLQSAGINSDITGYAGIDTTSSANTFNGESPFYQTRLVSSVGFISLGSLALLDDSSDYRVVTRSDNKRVVYVEESHVSVIKPSPTKAPGVEAFRTTVPRLNDSGEENALTSTLSGSGGTAFFNGSDIVESGDSITLSLDSGVDFRAGDNIKLIRQDNNQESITAFEEYDVLVQIVSGGSQNGSSLQDTYQAKIIYINTNVIPTDTDWYVAIDSGEALFEFKFPRFSYRYKYEDGEYSTYAPWSNVAFLSDAYDYAPEQGHNLGMTNQVKSLKINGYHPQEFNMPQDVVEVDVLYKETNNPTVYVVKTIKPTDGHPIWPSQGVSFSTVSRGELVIETDTIYNTVASNQLLRPYDNVPRSAVTQDISANRLIYGNYVQNYTIEKEPDIVVSYDSTKTNRVDGDYAPPSVKSDRSYQVGIVFSDKYGRESAVVTNKNATVKIPHVASTTRNRLCVKLNQNALQIPSWAEYFSYYVKESSDEYYNLTMDRWYYTSDGNIWLSFPSSERNKINDDSYITLKKAHGSSAAAGDKARYKVIDISNEVPNEVKTRKLNIGSLGVFDSGQSAIGGGGIGFPKVSSTFVTVLESDFENAFGEDLNIKTLENLRLRFFGPVDNKASQVYKVSNLSKSSGSDGKYKLKIEGIFEDDCEFILGEQQLTANMRADLIMTLYADEVKMRPEYSGRFFVKIYKNELLEKYILSQKPNPSQYEILATWGLRYIGNNGYVNAGTHANTQEIPYNAKEFNDQWGNSLNGISPNPDVSYSHNSTASNGSDHPSEYNWGGYEFPAGTPAFTGIGGLYSWGGDDNAFGMTADDLNSDSDDDIGPVGALAGRGGSTSEGDAEAFWLGVAGSKDFFIDACTAYSWTAKGNQSDFAPDDDTPGNEWSTNNGENGHHSASQSIKEGETAAQEEDQVAPEFYSHGNLAGNTGYRKGQPSRGIWGGGKYMDISWTGMGAGHTGGTLNDKDYPIAHQLKNVTEGGDFSNAWKFISKFVTPGTKFRFGRDPDATVYTTASFRNESIGGEQLGWANNSNSPGLNTAENDDSTGFDNKRYFSGTNKYTGVFGIRNFWTQNQNDQYYGHNLRQRWTVKVDPPIGSGPSGYNPTQGTDPELIKSNAVNAMGNPNGGNFRRALRHDGGFCNNASGFPAGNRKDTIEIVRAFESANSDHYAADSAVWETEPNEVPDLDIYYQASNLNPIRLTAKTKEDVIPVGSTFDVKGYVNIPAVISENEPTEPASFSSKTTTHTVTGWKSADGKSSDTIIKFTPALGLLTAATVTPTQQYLGGCVVNKPDGSSTNISFANTVGPGGTNATIDGGSGSLGLSIHEHKLTWTNCWAFGNGVESDRIRDDFNAVQMDNGVKASSVLQERLKEERRKHGLIWSGIYNSTSGVNNINQFIMAEPITKDINPIYGSIQKLVNRNTRLIIFCEDKVLHAETNKDLLFNADGSSQVVSSNKVVGSASAYQGNYGVGVSPESVVATPHQIYFADPYRGHVLSLTGEGARSISDKGMKDYFAKKFSSYSDSVMGSYDERKGEYNLTISKKHAIDAPVYYEQTTVSFSEIAKGWTSFRYGGDRHPTSAATINNSYYTFYNGHIWKHHSNATRNNFYDIQYNSDVTILFNENAGGVKSWGAINYEGSKARTTNFDLVSAQMFNNDYSSTTGGALKGLDAAANISDGEYHNLEATINGWYIDNITTNLQECGEIEFKDKEGKYFGYPSGVTTTQSNLDEKEFSVQGLGDASIVHTDPSLGATITITVANNTSTTYETGGGSGGTDWDAIAD